MKNKNIDATKGDIKKNLWILAWPIMIGNLIQVIYNMTDTYWVGKLDNSTEAIAAVTITFSVVFVLVSLAAGLGIGSATLAAQYYGAREYKKVDEVTYTSLIVIGAIALVFVAGGIIFYRQLFDLLQTPDNIIPIAKDYFIIIMVGMIFMFIFFIMSGILRGVGDTRTPMIAGIVSGVINMILDPFLIFGWWIFPELGISGAAYATVISRVFASGYIFYVVLRGKTFLRMNLRNIKVDLKITKQLFKIGVPSSISQAVISLGGTVIISRVNMFGDVAIATHGIGNRLESLLAMPTMGLAQAASSIVGQNLGAGQKERAFKSGQYAMKASFIILVILGAIFAIFPTVFFDIFSDDTEVIGMGRYYIYGITLLYAFVGCRIVMSNVFQGAGAASVSMWLSLICLWGFRVPLSYALSYTPLGIKGLWLGVGLSFIVSFFFMYYFYKKGNWMNKVVVEKKEQVEA
ncbi:MATE family efflux transporter [Vallitalea guaymasensis]|uniref:Probable multidrug resistance protein NorM n=1 Tax=Vallitalea guaymasensis TaxID=1185412 RepID=A0A8J8MC05_9FIRM|nr:MATE family efflux transporter [Vallitalea guaymasensis]QUH29910.1 MATE family efflux transporter [Vallitalea guaymasensis]